MIAGQYRKDTFRPQVLDLAIFARRSACDEGDIELMLTDGGNMFCRIAIDQFDKDARVFLVIGAQKLEQEPRRKR